MPSDEILLIPSGKPCLFLDRDGVLNEDLGFVHEPQNIRFIEGIFDFCSLAKDLGFLIIVITNQSGIERGLFSQLQFEEVMQFILQEFSSKGCPIDGYYFSPHMPYEVGGGKIPGFRRKPSPEMFLRAATDYQIQLSQSVMVGDRESDLHAASSAGISQLYLRLVDRSNQTLSSGTLEEFVIGREFAEFEKSLELHASRIGLI